MSGRGERILPLASVSIPALGPTQPPVQWVPGVLSPGLKCGRGETLSTHPHLVPRSRMSRSYISSPPRAFVACRATALALAYTTYSRSYTSSPLGVYMAQQDSFSFLNWMCFVPCCLYTKVQQEPTTFKHFYWS
jgi:hypothetical protein